MSGSGPDGLDASILDESILDELSAMDRAGARGFLRQIVEVFEAQALGILDELAEAARADDQPRLAALAHKLKGSARTVGAKALGMVCEQLESRARVGEAQAPGRSVEAIEAAFAQARVALHARV